MNNKVLLYLYSVDGDYAAAAVDGIMMMNINLQMYNHAHAGEYIYMLKSCSHGGGVQVMLTEQNIYICRGVG